MKLSIIIPYFKPDFFRWTLESLANQSNQNFKVFIFDDASPDDPVRIIEHYRDVLEISYYRFNDNLGSISLAAHWNRCLERIPERGWVQILGDDDSLGRDCVKDFFHNLKAIEECNARVTRFSSVMVDASNRIISKVHDHPKTENSVEYIFKKITGKSRSSLSEHIFKSEIARNIKFQHFPLAWHSDDVALLEFSDFQDIFSINSSKVFIRFSDLNISGKKDLAKQKNIASLHFYRYLEKNYPERLSRIQKEILSRKLEKCAINEKRNISLFFKVSYWYLQELNFKKYLRFVMAYLHETIRILRTSPYKT